MKKSLSIILAILLVFSCMLVLTACGGEKASDGNIAVTTEQSENPLTPTGSTEIGEGETAFTFSVVDTEGKSTSFYVHTDKTTVGEALLDCGLIAGENGPYGLYVKTVNGITLDYDKDGQYWAFYVNDEYAATGVDMTEIKDGESYCFKAE